MNEKKYNEIIDEINNSKSTFERTWDAPFSLVQLRFILEKAIAESEQELGLKRNIYDKMKKRLKRISKKIESTKGLVISSIVNDLIESFILQWKNTSDKVHYSSEYTEPSKISKQIIASKIFSSGIHLLKIVFLNKIDRPLVQVTLESKVEINNISEIETELFKIKEENEQLLKSAEEQKNEKEALVRELESKRHETGKVLLYKELINKKNLEIESLNGLKIQINTFKNELDDKKKKMVEKETEISLLSYEISKLKTLKEEVARVSLSDRTVWLSIFKNNVNKSDFLTIVFGEDRFRSKKSASDHLLGFRASLSEDILSKWKEKQSKINKVHGEALLNHDTVPSDDTFFVPSNMSAFIANDSDVRYDDESNGHFAYIKLSDKHFNILKENNFVVNARFIKQEYEWHLFTAWSKGIKNINIILFNGETLEWKKMPTERLDKWKSRFNNYELLITGFMREVANEYKV